MKIYDISRGFFSTPAYPGDPKARFERLKTLDRDGYTLSLVTAVVHTATHADAPLHFLPEGKSIDQMPPELYVGECSVVTVSGAITADKMKEILLHTGQRLLIKGNGTAWLTPEAAALVAVSDIVLIGTDSNSIAYETQEAEVHKTVLQKDIAVLENLELSAVCDGNYFLFALPVKMEGLEGAPVRAVLTEL